MNSGKTILMSFLAFYLLLFACSKRHNKLSSAEINELYLQGYEPVKVVDSREIAGCGYLLQRADSSLYRPVNLAPSFQTAGLHLWVKVEIMKHAVSACMRGQSVKIIDLKPENR